MRKMEGEQKRIAENYDIKKGAIITEFHNAEKALMEGFADKMKEADQAHARDLNLMKNRILNNCPSIQQIVAGS